MAQPKYRKNRTRWCKHSRLVRATMPVIDRCEQRALATSRHCVRHASPEEKAAALIQPEVVAC